MFEENAQTAKRADALSCAQEPRPTCRFSTLIIHKR